MNTQQYDVLVCGNGIAGLASALACARQRLHVAVLAPSRTIQHNLGDDYHPRIYAISNQSQQFLNRLGVWSAMPQERITEVQKMRVAGDMGGCFTFDAYQAVMQHLAFIVESGEIEFALMQSLRVLGVDFIEDSFDRVIGQEAVTASGQRIAFDLLVGADGSKSRVRHGCGISAKYTPYNDKGLVCQFNTELPHCGQAFQWFDGNSVMALLPLPDVHGKPQVSLVWSMPDSEAAVWLDMDPEEIRAKLPLAVGRVSQGMLGRLQMLSPLRGFPLTLGKSDLIANHVALVGDAAHQVHPLAGQGLNLGLADVETLDQVIREREDFRSVGDARVLDRYKYRRSAALMQMRLVTDGLHKLFRQQWPAAGLLRNVGMSLLNYSPWMKRRLVQSATGPDDAYEAGQTTSSRTRH